MGWDGGGGGLTLCKRWGGMEVGEDSLYVRYVIDSAEIVPLQIDYIINCVDTQSIRPQAGKYHHLTHAHT